MPGNRKLPTAHPAALTRDSLQTAVQELCARDADLCQVVERYGSPPLWARQPGFATLVRIMLEQQVSLASAWAAFTRLRNGVGRVVPARIAPLPLNELQKLGLTRQKAEYIQGVARAQLAGEIELQALARADDAGARETLCRIRGVGPWTADIYLIMALRRPDVWPDGDLALVSSMQHLKRLRARLTPLRARKIASAWRPWRAVAARILWHHYLSS